MDDIKCICGRRLSQHGFVGAECAMFVAEEGGRPCTHDWQPHPRGGSGRICPMCQAKLPMTRISLPIRHDLSSESGDAGEAREIAGFYEEFPRGEMSPAIKSVYERARYAANALLVDGIDTEFRVLLEALDAGEAAEKRAAKQEIERMNLGADLCSARTVLTQRAETAERERDEARIERDRLKAIGETLAEECDQMRSERDKFREIADDHLLG